MSFKLMPGLRRFIPIPLKRQQPDPADIDIAQAADLKPPTQLAEELGILPDELEVNSPVKTSNCPPAFISITHSTTRSKARSVDRPRRLRR